ncbi:phosphoribosyltransferase-like protein [Ancylobacter koreensis]|uniref:phosphoribosyltransferase-like protein n=1 Tax=Ancylobacter koreensis TaxID=266121 RepID=UPI003CCFEA69
MEVSETLRGRNWLSNFAPEQQVVAKRLLDAVELVGQDQFRNGLVRLISGLPKKVQKPIALVPVREMAPGQNYFGPDKNASPRLLNSGSFPGSEGIVANVLGALRRQNGNEGAFVAAPSLKNMRAARCRTILYVDDFSGSGKRILDFHRSFMTSKTMKSWKSYGLVKFHVALFAATPHAREVLNFTFGDQNVHVVTLPPTSIQL